MKYGERITSCVSTNLSILLSPFSLKSKNTLELLETNHINVIDERKQLMFMPTAEALAVQITVINTGVWV